MEMSYSHIDFWKLFLKNLFMKPLAIALLMLWKRLKNFTFFSPLFNNDSMYFTLTFLTTFDCIRDISSYTKNTNSSRMFDNNAHDSHSGKPMCERERSRSGLTVECNTLLESNLVESSLSCLHYTRAIWTHSFISLLSPSVYTNLSRKQSFLGTLFKPEKFGNAGLAF